MRLKLCLFAGTYPLIYQYCRSRYKQISNFWSPSIAYDEEYLQFTSVKINNSYSDKSDPILNYKNSNLRSEKNCIRNELAYQFESPMLRNSFLRQHVTEWI